MNARLPEGEPSNQPDARRDRSGETPSHHLLDDVMKGPRMWASYFDEQLDLRFPAGGYDLKGDKTEAAATRKLFGQLKSYELHWLKKYAAQSTESFRSIGLFEPEELAAYNELTFHVINQHVMPHWYRAFDQRSTSKPEVRTLNAAQIKLALETATLLRFKKEQEKEFEDSSYVDQQLADIDTAIALLQVMIDAPYEGLDDVLITPAPLLPDPNQRPGFLVFEPDYQQAYQMDRIDSIELQENMPSRAPGHLAQIALARTKISSLSFMPEFNDRVTLHSFMSAKMDTPHDAADDSALEETRQILGGVLRERFF